MTPQERSSRIAKRMRALIATGEATAGPPVSEEAIARAEAELGHSLSPSCRWFLLEFGAAVLPDQRQRIGRQDYGRSQILAPEAPGRAGLLPAASALRAGKHGSPPPASVYPFAVWECRLDRKPMELVGQLDSADVDGDGEHQRSWFPSAIKLSGSRTFFDYIEDEIDLESEWIETPAPYESTAERLYSDLARDGFLYGPPVSPDAIAQVESRLGFAFPEAYRRFLMEFGEAELGPRFLPLSPDADGSLLAVMEEQRRATPPMPEELVPFAVGIGGVGNGRFAPCFYCFDRGRSFLGDVRVSTWTPEDAEDRRLSRLPLTFLGWIDQKAKSLEEHISPPRDWNNIAGWDRYWTRNIAHENWRNTFCFPFVFGMPGVDWLRAHGCLRILFAGNGIALHPHAYASVGFDVTALDISTVATRFLDGYEFEQGGMDRLVSHYIVPGHSRVNGPLRDRTERGGVMGGRLHAVAADLFTYSPPEPFDLICASRLLHGFEGSERAQLVARLAGWLRPGGVCYIDTINAGEELRRAQEADFVAAGFHIDNGEPERCDDRATGSGWGLGGRKRQDRAERDRRHDELLARGGKLAIFIYGSG
ncbi:MAG TPA: SMI1/KNR4 family protein [Armatimonadota bacterium]|jgi:SAM-dependent methyltransferase